MGLNLKPGLGRINDFPIYIMTEKLKKGLHDVKVWCLH